MLNTSRRLTLDSTEIARRIVDAAVDKKASDVVLLDIRELSVISDFFVICTGANPRQIDAIANSIDEQLGKFGYHVTHREGRSESGWILLDVGGEAICHIFGPRERDYYQLESLWNAAPRLLYVE
jgi:ribosome-associated protein